MNHQLPSKLQPLGNDDEVLVAELQGTRVLLLFLSTTPGLSNQQPQPKIESPGQHRQRAREKLTHAPLSAWSLNAKTLGKRDVWKSARSTYEKELTLPFLE
ncbi:hypothetical protein E2C01_076616 [Portunus trituberculatus]|uniref:Uncharacterized protein n=1 Tax=Portunus trituberculatus TaxID=210409 RepID=A0A5B7IP12_PORTR|nr:hypothetical protein [Portunus trituberculatus]